MSLSARNQLNGTIKNIRKGDAVSEVIIDVGGQEVCSTITTNSVENLNLKAGDSVKAVIKASNVMVMK